MYAMKDWIITYFVKLKDILVEHQLLDKPGQIYVVDKTKISLDH